MQTQTTLTVVTTTPTAQSKSYNISYCNNNATNATLAEFGRKLNSLTTNTLNSIFRTTKEDITDATA